MKTTIDAMKQAASELRQVQQSISRHPVLGFNVQPSAITELDEAIEREEAQTAEPCPTCGETTPFSGSCGTSDSDTKALCKRTAPPQSGERAALIARLRNTRNWQRESFGSWKNGTLYYDRAPFEAADMLAVDAQKITTLKEWQTYSLNEIARLETCLANPAQQVAVPQGLEGALVIECERAMRQRDAFLKTGVSTASHGGSHDTCFGVILRKYLAAPQPPQAEIHTIEAKITDRN